MALSLRRDVYLSPDDDCESALLAACQSAQHSLHLLCYALTDDALIALLLAKHAAGLDVGVCVDSTQAAGKTQAPKMRRMVDAGIPLTITRSPKGGICHHKAALIDVAHLGPLHGASLVVYGSYNFSGATAEAQGNILIVDSDPVLCDYYMAAFDEFDHFGRAHCTQLTPSPVEAGGNAA